MSLQFENYVIAPRILRTTVSLSATATDRRQRWPLTDAGCFFIPSPHWWHSAYMGGRLPWRHDAPDVKSVDAGLEGALAMGLFPARAAGELWRRPGIGHDGNSKKG